nr:PREDICTED: glutamic acid-rich protein-like [Megachile rotundata]
MKCGVWNARSVRNKREEVRRLTEGLDVLAIVETWLRPEEMFRIPGWHVIRKDSETENRSGGMCVMVRENIKVLNTGVYLRNNSKWKNMCVEIKTMRGKLEIVLVYRRPGTGLSKEECRRLFRNARAGNKRIFIGDFNAKSRSWNCESSDVAGEVLEEVLDEENMVVVNFGTLSRIGRPDQVASNIDLVITTAEEALNVRIRETGETGGSDHQVIEFGSEDEVREIVRGEKRVEDKCRDIVNLMKRGIEENYKGGNRGRERENRGNVNGNVSRNRDRNGGERRKEKRQPWLDEECEELKEERRKAVKEMGKRPTEENWNKLKEARKKMEEAVKRKKKKAWEDFAKSIKYKGNVGEMWKRVRSLAKGVAAEDQRNIGIWEIQKLEEEEVRKLEESEYCCRCEEGEREEEDAEREEEGTMEAERNDGEETAGIEEEEEEWIVRDFEMEELEEALSRVKGKAAPGEDGIGYDIIKLWTMGWKEAMLELYNEI